jgi:hypothetical protein
MFRIQVLLFNILNYEKEKLIICLCFMLQYKDYEKNLHFFDYLILIGNFNLYVLYEACKIKVGTYFFFLRSHN